MNTGNKFKLVIANGVLYLFIIATGLQMGAAVYENFVVTPLWAGSLPESVINWNPVKEYAVEPGRYWGKFSPFHALCTVLLLGTAWLMRGTKRRWALTAGALSLLIVISTFFFFVPILMKTIFTNGAGLSGDEITRLANSWVNWNWLRLAAGFASWLAAIRALALPERDFDGDSFGT